ncbi:MAG: histidine kinase [Bacteroidota bacterium]
MLCWSSQAQEFDISEKEQYIDSLKSVLTDENIEENADNYIEIIAFYARKNSDSSKKYADRYAAFTTPKSKLYYDAISRKVHLLQIEGNYGEVTEILQHIFQNDSVILHQPDKKYLLLKLYTQMAEVYMDQAAYEDALKIYYKSTNIYEEEGITDDTTYFVNIHSISTILAILKYFDKSLIYAKKLEKILHSELAQANIDAKKRRSLVYLVLHNYIHSSGLYRELNALDKAIKYTKKGKELCIAEEEYRMLPKIYATEGNLYIATQEYEKAVASGLDTLKFEKQYQYPEYKATFLSIVGNAYLKLKKYEEAIRYLEQSIAATNVETLKINTLTSLGNAYQGINNAEKVIEILIERSELQDVLAGKNQRAAVAEITAKYENEKKQKQIQLLQTESSLQQLKIQQQSYVLYGIIGLILFLLIVGVIWYKNRRQQQQLKEAVLQLDKEKLQQRFLRTQLNPHFFFHALASIESYIYKEDKETAADFLQKFSALMRAILESSDIDFISLQSDIDFIQKYLALQSIHNTQKFTYKVTVASDVKCNNIMIPPMLMQPFVENAIIHGISNQENGHIDIAYFIQKSQLVITITDNGKGIQNASKKSGMLHRSMSTEITKQRINTIQKVHDFLIKYTLVSAEKTTVTFFIPIKYGNFSFAVA